MTLMTEMKVSTVLLFIRGMIWLLGDKILSLPPSVLPIFQSFSNIETIFPKNSNWFSAIACTQLISNGYELA